MDEDVTNFLSRQYGGPRHYLSYFEIDPRPVVKLIPYETAKRYRLAAEPGWVHRSRSPWSIPTNVFAMDDN